MIDSYLKSLAATVRDLVASGKAVHVTNETAAELDSLAGLPWNQAPLLILKERVTAPGQRDGVARPITPADLALGWLLASRTLSQGQIWHDNAITCQEVLTSDRHRAAECAELALISVALLPRFEGTEPGVLQSHQGTREGARAAWAFVAMKLTRSADSIKENMRKPDANTDCCVSRLKLNRVADRYRRELEAM